VPASLTATERAPKIIESSMRCGGSRRSFDPTQQPAREHRARPHRKGRWPLREFSQAYALPTNDGPDERQPPMNEARRRRMTPETKFEPSHVNVRMKISALWTSLLFVFAYVDLFSLYRRDFQADVAAGEVGGFTVNQSFLLATTLYVVIPSLMVFCALILRPRVDRIANIALSIVYALTTIAGAIGEWNYYILGSAIEVALLAAIVYFAWTWPKETPPSGRPRSVPV
jgi:Family of unknown function (DUF6326)